MNPVAICVGSSISPTRGPHLQCKEGKLGITPKHLWPESHSWRIFKLRATKEVIGWSTLILCIFLERSAISAYVCSITWHFS